MTRTNTKKGHKKHYKKNNKSRSKSNTCPNKEDFKKKIRFDSRDTYRAKNYKTAQDTYQEKPVDYNTSKITGLKMRKTQDYNLNMSLDGELISNEIRKKISGRDYIPVGVARFEGEIKIKPSYESMGVLNHLDLESLITILKNPELENNTFAFVSVYAETRTHYGLSVNIYYGETKASCFLTKKGELVVERVSIVSREFVNEVKEYQELHCLDLNNENLMKLRKAVSLMNLSIKNDYYDFNKNSLEQMVKRIKSATTTRNYMPIGLLRIEGLNIRCSQTLNQYLGLKETNLEDYFTNFGIPDIHSKVNEALANPCLEGANFAFLALNKKNESYSLNLNVFMQDSTINGALEREGERLILDALHVCKTGQVWLKKSRAFLEKKKECIDLSTLNKIFDVIRAANSKIQH